MYNSFLTWVGDECVVIPNDRWIGNVTEPIHAVRVHLPPQNTVYDHESRFATASHEKNQLLHHGERSLSLL